MENNEKVNLIIKEGFNLSEIEINKLENIIKKNFIRFDFIEKKFTYQIINNYRLLVRNKNFIIIKIDNKIVGFLSYEKKKFIKIHQIYILPKYQGCNYGKILMDKLFDISKKNNIYFLQVNIHNIKAIKFYEKLGFKIKKKVKKFFDNFTFEDYLMCIKKDN